MGRVGAEHVPPVPTSERLAMITQVLSPEQLSLKSVKPDTVPSSTCGDEDAGHAAVAALYAKLNAAGEYSRLGSSFSTITGFLAPLEGYTLMGLAAVNEVEGAVVEIGSFMGLSTSWLATGAKEAGTDKVVAIDHFQGSPEHQKGEFCEDEVVSKVGSTYFEFEKNLRSRSLWDQVDVRVGSSEEVAKSWDGPIRLLFIDGDHSWKGVRTDFALWSPHVARGGLIAFHDVDGWPDVTRFYRALLLANGGYVEVLQIGSLGVVQKTV
jgi:predicted O-methyltransferase YrrM